ncbi:hypothetical protein [Kitasatospora sp. NPDC048538]|uniref:hypothetical protein n=1 Tax=unclassified Kitasatospora TaxID=2633591 RepID=UPI0033CC8E5E
MGDGQELLPAVVGGLVRAAEGVAGGPGRAVADLVRTRLRASAEGARAVAAIEANPGDARARSGLTAAVGDLLAADPAFARYLATTELGKPPEEPTVHLRVDPAVAGSTARAARLGAVPVLVTLSLVVVAALVAVGINLGSRPLLQPNGPDLAHAGRTLRDPAQVRAVLPDLSAMPGGWQVRSGPTSGAGPGADAPCLVPDACDRQLAYATVTFASSGTHSAQFTVVTFASPETAGRAFDLALARIGGDGASVLPLPPIGDQSAARTDDTQGTDVLVRVGSALLDVRDPGPGSTAAPALTLFAGLLADRARAALGPA